MKHNKTSPILLFDYFDFYFDLGMALKRVNFYLLAL
jgi:hypothetical protein